MIYGTFIQSHYFWYLISGRQNTPHFLVFIVSGVSRIQIIKGKIPRQFFIRRRVEERRSKAGGPRGPNGVGPRGPCTWPRGTHQLAPRAPPRVGLFTDTFVFAEKGRPNFPRIIWGRGGGGAPDSLRRGQILLLRSPAEGEIIAIVITSPPWRGRRPLHQRHHQDHHHLRDPLRSPHSLRVAIP